jgi:hypothetical protein
MKPVSYLSSAFLLLSTSLAAFAETPSTPPAINASPGTITAQKLTFANANAKYATPAPGYKIPAVAPSAMRAYIDPETNALTKPNQLHLLEDAEQAKSDRAKSNGQSATVHSVEVMPGGGMRGKVSASGHSFMTASVGPNGELSVVCEEDHSKDVSTRSSPKRAAPHSHLTVTAPVALANARKELNHVK